MKHISETSETLETYSCNVPLKHFQHVQHSPKHFQYVQHSPIYFYNIHMIQLQHTSEMSKTIETYNYDIGGEEPSAWSAMVAGVGEAWPPG
jgi:hypothetical protein